MRLRPMEIPKVMPEIPQLEPYETVLVELDKGTYAYAVLTLQARLKELGYQDGKPDGIYGDGTVEAVKAFQRKAGLKADGIAGVENSNGDLCPGCAQKIRRLLKKYC